MNHKHIDYILETISENSRNTKQAALKILNNFDNFDAIIAANDIYAAAIVLEAKKKHLMIPKDIQVVGYDANPLSQYTTPTISTIDQQPILIGKTAAKRLLEMINGNYSTDNKIIPIKIIKNSSTM